MVIKMKRFITLLLLAAMLVSCGSGTSVEKDTTAGTTDSGTTDETTAETKTDGLPDVDMDGFVFSVYHHSADSMHWTNTTLDVESETGEVLEDSIYRRNRSVEERFNCVIETAEYNNGEISSTMISKEVMAGDSTYDLWFPRDYNVAASIPYLRPLNDLPYLDLDADWWFPNASKVFRFNDQQWSATSAFSLSMIARAGGMVFNKNMYDTIGAEKTPYEYVRDNEWTLDTLASVAKLGYRDLNGNTELDKEDCFGISGWCKELYARFLNGSGIRFINTDENGYPSFDLPSDQAAIDKMIHIYEIFKDKEIYNNPDSIKRKTSQIDSWGLLKDRTSLFRTSNPSEMDKECRHFDFDGGFVVCPKYDSSQEEYYSSTWAAEMNVVLKTLPDERLENVSIILEALSYSGYHDVVPIYRETTMKGKLAQDTESEEMFDIVLNSMCFDFGLIVWEGPVADPIIAGIYASNDGNVVSTLAKLEGKINGVIEDLNENLAAEQ